MHHYFIDTAFGADVDTLARVLELLGRKTGVIGSLFGRDYRPVAYSQLGDTDIYIDTEVEISEKDVQRIMDIPEIGDLGFGRVSNYIFDEADLSMTPI
jgi:hypothetical protein